METVSTIAINVLLVILGINALIIVHEFGHFIAARLCGVRCEKFYIWFDFWGLKFFKFRWGETEYGLGLFPLGGYVKMLGQVDDPAQISTQTEVSPDSFTAKSIPKRMSIVVAGVAMNLIFAIVCATAASMIGLPDASAQQIVQAENLGEALQFGTQKTMEYSFAVVEFLGGLLSGTVSPQEMGGPIMIVQTAYQFVDRGMGVYLMFLCLIGANLAVINLLPIPILDGGHLLFLLYESIFRKPPQERFAVIVGFLGLAFLVTVMLWTVYLDLGRIV